MATLQFYPPSPASLQTMVAIPGMTMSSGMIVAQRGPAGALGPEGAGAVLMLQATFADPTGAENFWSAASHLMELLAGAPGFIRRFSFADGPSIYLIALWRSIGDAKAFAGSVEHRAAVRDLYAHRWQYSHFSALWELASSHGRQIFCDQCDGVTPAMEGACSSCGVAFNDVFADAEPLPPHP